MGCTKQQMGVQMAKVKRICAWCNKLLGYKEVEGYGVGKGDTHGICDECKEKVLREYEEEKTKKANAVFKIYKISGLFSIEPKILSEIQTYVNGIFEDFNMNERSRVSKKSYPAKKFMLDFSGTRWGFLRPVPCTITFSADSDSYFNHLYGGLRINIGLRDGRRYEVVEHEFLHYLQDLIASQKKTGDFAGAPNAREWRDDVDYNGYLKKDERDKLFVYRFYIQNKSSPAIVSPTPDKGSMMRSTIKIKARDEEDAIKRFRRRYKDYLKDTPIYALEDQSYRREIKKRVDHTGRPTEMYPDLNTAVRGLQKLWVILKNSGRALPSKEEFFGNFMKGNLHAYMAGSNFKDMPMILPKALYISKYLDEAVKELNKHKDEFKKNIRGKAYKEFMEDPHGMEDALSKQLAFNSGVAEKTKEVREQNSKLETERMINKDRKKIEEIEGSPILFKHNGVEIREIDFNLGKISVNFNPTSFRGDLDGRDFIPDVDENGEDYNSATEKAEELFNDLGFGYKDSIQLPTEWRFMKNLIFNAVKGRKDNYEAKYFAIQYLKKVNEKMRDKSGKRFDIAEAYKLIIGEDVPTFKNEEDLVEAKNWYGMYKEANVVREEDYIRNEHRIVEVAVVGDYELVLAKAGGREGRMFAETEYQLALQHKDHNAMNLDTHRQKTVKDIPPNMQDTAGKMKAKLLEWIDRYGVIAVASMSQKKVRQYFKILSRFGLPLRDESYYLLIG